MYLMYRNQVTRRFDLIYEWDNHHQMIIISLVKRDQTKAIRVWQLPAAMEDQFLDAEDFASYAFLWESTPLSLMEYITDTVHKLKNAYYSAKYNA